MRGPTIVRAALAATLLAFRGVEAAGPGTLVHDTIEYGGRLRTYSALVPDGVEPAGLVLALHGSGGSGARLRSLLPGSFEREAARRALIVIYPDGVEGHWNGCRAAAQYAANVKGVDDPGFLQVVVERVTTRYDAPRKLGVVGFSNGGHMALRLAVEWPAFAGGIVVLGASLPSDEASDCATTAEPERVLLIAGLADPINPPGGGRVRLPDGRDFGPVRSLESTAQYFAATAGLHEPRGSTMVDSSGRVVAKRVVWGAASMPQVVLLTLDGAGHTIPGSTASWPAWVGPVETRVDAGLLALEFLFGAVVPGAAGLRSRS